MMSYATPDRKGLYIGIFWILFNMGGMLGGILSMAINWSGETGGLSAASYFAFVAIMMSGALGGILLTPSAKVIREDGAPVVFEKAKSAKEEIMGALRVVKDRTMLLLTLLFLASNWCYPYQFNGVNGSIFTVRTRGLNTALYWGFEMLGFYTIGRFLDRKNKSVRRRAYQGLAMAFTCLNVAFFLEAFVQYKWDDGLWDKHRIPETGKWSDPFEGRKVDMTDSSRAAFPMLTYVLYGISDAMIQTYAYWHMGAAAGDDPSLAARYAGYYKGVQSIGAAIPWLLDLLVPYEPQFWICWSLFWVAFPFIIISFRDLPAEETTKSVSMNEIAQKPSDSLTQSCSDKEPMRVAEAA